MFCYYEAKAKHFSEESGDTGALVSIDDQHAVFSPFLVHGFS